MIFDVGCYVFLVELLSIIQENINYLLIPQITLTTWISIFIKHQSVQDCVAILTLGVYISTRFNQLTDRLDVFIDSGDE